MRSDWREKERLTFDDILQRERLLFPFARHYGLDLLLRSRSIAKIGKNDLGSIVDQRDLTRRYSRSVRESGRRSRR